MRIVPGVVHRHGAPDAAWSVWVVEQQEATVKMLIFQSLLFLRHPGIPGDAWATPMHDLYWISDARRFGAESFILVHKSPSRAWLAFHCLLLVRLGLGIA
ncbi:MAG: hypothetical protein DWH91_04280 [Planctomycetota bacterium]|nr:MAG: hypothetical protein DWH91_04280 [Planctomycetota bacterium]